MEGHAARILKRGNSGRVPLTPSFLQGAGLANRGAPQGRNPSSSDDLQQYQGGHEQRITADTAIQARTVRLEQEL